MTQPWILVSGFGSFEDVEDNPSRRIAVQLAREPPAAAEVRALDLPVSFRRATELLEEAFASFADAPPILLLGLGVHRDPWYRVELRARARLTRADRPDVDGDVAAAVEMAAGPDLRSPLEGRLRALAARAAWRVSEDAGGYVCERVYRRALELGEVRGVPVAFVHVPPESWASVGDQVREVREVIEGLVRG